jgi:hypothetical protein
MAPSSAGDRMSVLQLLEQMFSEEVASMKAHLAACGIK